MRELTVQEMDQAGGGFLPLLGLALAVAGKVTAGGGVTGWAIGSASVILAGYQAAEHYMGPNLRRKLRP